MANYTVTRQTEASHVYGCTNWSTFQQVGQTASDGGALDSTIVWDIKANTGYTVDVNKFGIANTSPGGIQAPTGTSKILIPNVGSGLAPILGIHMEQISNTLIRAKIYLEPNAALGITGAPFTMVDADIQVSVQIQGCADIEGEGVHVRFVRSCENVEAKVDIAQDFRDGILSHEVLDSNTTDQVFGTLPSVSINTSNSDIFICSYTLIAPTGKYFTNTPLLNSVTQEYYYTTAVQSDSDGYSIIINYNIFKYN